MKVHRCQQRTPEWRQLRIGQLTSTCMDDMLATRKDSKEAAGRRNLRMRLVLERVTGRSLESEYVSQAMLQGAEREADAATIYEIETGRLLWPVGFCAHDELAAGCSPDGVIGDFEGIVEIKSPLAATHWEYIESGEVPLEYRRQVAHLLWITGAAWCDWLSYHPDFPEPLRVKLVRIERHESAMVDHELKARQFLREVDEQYAAIMRRAMVAA